jgi:hypothetical protein
MPDLGDRVEDSTIDFAFFTTDAAAAPTTLSGTPAVSVYKANGTTQSTAGVTLTADFDSVTGLNHVRIDTSADAFYATGNDYMAVITAGTVDGISVVGSVVATFSIENRCVNTITGNLDGTVGSLAAQAKADVNAEVLDVMNTDTFGEPTGVPAATASLVSKIGRLHMALRNKVTVTATKKTFFDDDDNAEWEQDLADNGSEYSQSEANAV